MQIALCDDEPTASALLGALIQAYCDKECLALQIDYFSSGEAFLASSQQYEIVFMDIYMTGITGMETVRALSCREHYQIVFTTNSPEHALEAFAVNATHYLLKPITESGLADAMNRCFSNRKETPVKIIELKNSQGLVPVSMPGIIYAEVFDKISIVHTQHGDIQANTPLDAICEQLDDSFLRVQRSFVVNMNFIESYLADRVILHSGEELTLSRGNRVVLKKKYQQFLFRLARCNQR